MTQARKFKDNVREFAALNGLSYQAAHRMIPRKFYASVMVIAALDGLVIGRRVVNLSSFPKTGDCVRLNDGTRYQVWHPVLKARIAADTDPSDLPAICVHPVPTSGPASVVEVVAGERVMPVLMDLHSNNHPRVRRFVTRPYAEGDGIDIELPDPPFGTRMHGHHVYRVGSGAAGGGSSGSGSGLYLKQEMLDVEYMPHRIRLPKRNAPGEFTTTPQV